MRKFGETTVKNYEVRIDKNLYIEFEITGTMLVQDDIGTIGNNSSSVQFQTCMRVISVKDLTGIKTIINESMVVITTVGLEYYSDCPEVYNRYRDYIEKSTITISGDGCSIHSSKFDIFREALRDINIVYSPDMNLDEEVFALDIFISKYGDNPMLYMEVVDPNTKTRVLRGHDYSLKRVIDMNK